MENQIIFAPDLEAAKNRFEQWRANKRSSREPIPEELWETAQELSKKYSINEVSKCLRLNFTDLKKRVLGKGCKTFRRNGSAPFIELSSEKLFSRSECIIEMEDKTGCRMKMCFRGETNFDLLELGKSFWSKKR